MNRKQPNQQAHPTIRRGERGHIDDDAPHGGHEHKEERPDDHARKEHHDQHHNHAHDHHAPEQHDVAHVVHDRHHVDDHAGGHHSQHHPSRARKPGARGKHVHAEATITTAHLADITQGFSTTPVGPLEGLTEREPHVLVTPPLHIRGLHHDLSHSMTVLTFGSLAGTVVMLVVLLFVVYSRAPNAETAIRSLEAASNAAINFVTHVFGPVLGFLFGALTRR